jgi:sugar diacid utilization regulator
MSGGIVMSGGVMSGGAVAPVGHSDGMNRLPDRGTSVVAQVTAESAAECDMPVALLGGYLTALSVVAGTGRRLSDQEESACRQLGGEAAIEGVRLPALVDLYMTASRRLWPRLPDLVAEARGRPLRQAEVVSLGESVWRAADTALAALAAGHVDARQAVVRREETFRAEFVDGLLSGRADVGSLVERAESFGLSLAGSHVVVVAASDRPITAGMSAPSGLEDDVRARLGGRGLLVAIREGRLVCVLSAGPATDDSAPAATDDEVLAELAGPAVARLTRRAGWRVGVGRPHPGPAGVPRSFHEALEAMDLADRLGLRVPIVHARDLLVYRVLMRDEAAIADLVQAVLGPLTRARGGADPFLTTLQTYFAAGGNAAETARRLSLSVRAITYRLQRVHELTGHGPADPADHLPLMVAVTGARLLDWPARPLTTG